jgi:hypothetical protein
MLEVAQKPEVFRRVVVSIFHDIDENLENSLIWLCGEASQEVLDNLEEHIDEMWALHLTVL